MHLIEQIVGLCCTAALVIVLVWHGWSGPPKLFAWGMYTQITHCYFDLEVETPAGRRPVNPFDYIPNQNTHFHAWRLANFLEYLADVRGIRPSGRILMVDGNVTWRLEIVNGRVANKILHARA